MLYRVYQVLIHVSVLHLFRKHVCLKRKRMAGGSAAYYISNEIDNVEVINIFVFFFLVLGIEPSASYMLISTCWAT